MSEKPLTATAIIEGTEAGVPPATGLKVEISVHRYVRVTYTVGVPATGLKVEFSGDPGFRLPWWRRWLKALFG